MELSKPFNPWREAYLFSTRGLYLGNEVESDENIYLTPKWLTTHLHLLGPTGVGKSRLLLWIFEHLCLVPKATIILLNPKGALATQARDWAILHGFTKRLIWFDPGDPEMVIGYNPLKPTGLPVATHAKSTREAIRASWGQNNFDETPQLARFLYLSLYVARERELTLVEAVGVLQNFSDLRRTLTPAIHDPFIRQAMEYLDSLKDQRRDELVASTLARLESFVLDPTIRRIIQQKRSLDLAEVIKNHKILLLNLEQYRPLRPDDTRILGRLIINDVLAHVFERPEPERTPVFLIIDELQDFATEDLCRAVEQGRELKLYCVLAHQHIGQLLKEDGSGRLLDSVKNNARTKIVFGGSAVTDLKDLTEELMIDQFDPWTIKDELTSLELNPVETTRKSRTSGGSYSEGDSHSHTQGTSKSESHGTHESETESETIGETEGTSFSTGKSKTKSQGWADTKGHGKSEGESEGEAWGQSFGHSTGAYSASGSGMSTNPEWETTTSSNSLSGMSAGDFASDGFVQSRARISMRSNFEARTESGGEAETHSQSCGTSSSRSRARSKGKTRGTSHTLEHGTSQSKTKGKNRTWARNESETTAPFYDYEKRRVVSSRAFLNKEEFLTLGLQKIKAQSTGHFLLKVPTHKAAFLRAPFVETPRITAKLLTAANERIFAQPFYSTREEAEAEERKQIELSPSLNATIKRGNHGRTLNPTEDITEAQIKQRSRRERSTTRQTEPPTS